MNRVAGIAVALERHAERVAPQRHCPVAELRWEAEPVGEPLPAAFLHPTVERARRVRRQELLDILRERFKLILEQLRVATVESRQRLRLRVDQPALGERVLGATTLRASPVPFGAVRRARRSRPALCRDRPFQGGATPGPCPSARSQRHRARPASRRRRCSRTASRTPQSRRPGSRPTWAGVTSRTLSPAPARMRR